MYVRLVVTFCNSEKVIKPKEAHIDYIGETYYKVGFTDVTDNK